MSEEKKFDFKPLLVGKTETEIIQHERDTVLRIPGLSFMAKNPDTDAVTYDIDECWVKAEADGIFFLATINLPQGAEIISVVMQGDATLETYDLHRLNPDTFAGTILATANIGTQTDTITSGIIDNNTFFYYLATSSLDTNDTIYGAKIIYKRG